jgi:uncharacterized membrane protein
MLISRPSAIGAGILFSGAGTAHFAKPDFFEAIVPAWFPNATLANRVSGAAELALGLGMFLPRTRKLSALGLFALTIAVFPANVDMAVNRDRPAELDPPAAPAAAFVVALEGIPRGDPLAEPVRA